MNLICVYTKKNVNSPIARRPSRSTPARWAVLISVSMVVSRQRSEHSNVVGGRSETLLQPAVTFSAGDWYLFNRPQRDGGMSQPRDRALEHDIISAQAGIEPGLSRLARHRVDHYASALLVTTYTVYTIHYQNNSNKFNFHMVILLFLNTAPSKCVIIDPIILVLNCHISKKFSMICGSTVVGV